MGGLTERVTAVTGAGTPMAEAGRAVTGLLTERPAEVAAGTHD